MRARGGELPESEGQARSALDPACSVASECASGFVCWTSGSSCVRASNCYSGSTGPGVFVGSLTLDGTDTAADLQSLGDAWCVTGDVAVKQTALTDLTGLGGLLTVAGTVSIEDNPGLVSLNGLNHRGLEQFRAAQPRLQGRAALSRARQPPGHFSTEGPLDS